MIEDIELSVNFVVLFSYVIVASSGFSLEKQQIWIWILNYARFSWWFYDNNKKYNQILFCLFFTLDSIHFFSQLLLP